MCHLPTRPVNEVGGIVKGNHWGERSVALRFIDLKTLLLPHSDSSGSFCCRPCLAIIWGGVNHA